MVTTDKQGAGLRPIARNKILTVSSFLVVIGALSLTAGIIIASGFFGAIPVAIAATTILGGGITCAGGIAGEVYNYYKSKDYDKTVEDNVSNVQ